MEHTSASRRFPAIQLLLTLALVSCSPASFDTPFTMYTSIASPDLNGDGHPDLAVANPVRIGS